MIHGHIGALLFLIKLQRKAAKNKLNYSSQTQLVQNFSSPTQSVNQDLVIFQEVPWNVDMSLFFDALEINKEETLVSHFYELAYYAVFKAVLAAQLVNE